MISNKQKTLKGSILTVLLLLMPSILYAACTGASPTWTTTPDYVSVNACVQNASTGDTINVINGTATWSNTITIRKAITINGNGATLTANGTMLKGLFEVTGFAANSLTRITGFTFQMVNWSAMRAIYVHDMLGGVSVGDIRIDHNTFHYGSEVVSFYHGKGLIDSNYFYNPIIGITLDAGTRANADESWESMTAGTADALFIEDNHFIANANYTYAGTQEQIGTENGGKLVIRYNDFDGTATNAPEGLYEPIMTHGNAGLGGSGGVWTFYWQQNDVPRRGQSVVEIYRNTIAANKLGTPIVLRGSANLVYDNTLTKIAATTPAIVLREEEYDYVASGYIQRTAWPAEDQVHNTFLWNNTINGSAIAVVSVPNADKGLQQNRDYFLHAPCGASDSVDAYGNVCTHGKASFTGANGASGSYPTNGSMYPTQGTMIFTKSGDNAYYGYTPYTYPHPLRNDTTSYSENPQSPAPTVPESPTTPVLPPTIAVSPTTKDFGTLPINTSSVAQSFTVTTTGGDLNVDAISVTGTDATQFTIQNDSCTGKIIAPTTGSCTFEAKFSPSSVGAKTANVSIVNNDSNTTEMIALNGTGIANQVPTLSFSPTSFLYGVLSDAWSSPQTITLSNNGAAPVTISSLTLSGTNANQFSIPIATDYCTGETVAAYGNCSFQVIFYLASTGKKTADVNVTALYYDSPASLALFGYTVIDRNKPITISKKK